MLSKSAKYALKAVFYLAVHSSENNKVMIKDIAKPINVPKAYIAKLLQKLSSRQIISSARGPNGGFYLNDCNRQNTIMAVIEVIDSEKNMINCLLSLEECNKDKPCPLHNISSASRTNLLTSFRSKSIQDLALEIEDGKAFLPL